MERETKSFWRRFRFTTNRGQTLTDRIAEIEALATKQLRAGVPENAVMEDAIALLSVACNGLHAGPATPPAAQLTKPPGLTRQPAKTHRLARSGTQAGGPELRHLQPIPTQPAQPPSRRDLEA